MAAILQDSCQIKCPHGGQCSPVTANQSVKVDSGFALLVSDTFTISGCTFTIPGTGPHPCVTISWSGPSQKVTVNGTPVLLESSVGQCAAADQAVQGVAMVSGVQTKVSAT